MNSAIDEEGNVKIPYAGLEGLRLKTALVNRLGPLVKVGKDSLIFPASCLPHLRDLLPPNVGSNEEVQRTLRSYDAHAIARDHAQAVMEGGIIQGLSEFWIQQLDPLQAVAVSAMVMPDLMGMCLFDEQGSGKTVMTIAAFDTLKSSGDIDRMIVVCPKSMISEWVKDIERFLPGKYLVEAAEGDRKDKYEASHKEFDVLVTNYEGIEPMRVALSSSASHKSYLLAVDESFYLKNSESLRAETARRLRESCKRCFVLCGTPAPNSAYDLINQFDLADLGYTFGNFRKTKDDLQDKEQISALTEVRGAFIRRLKSEILQEVPDKNFHVLRVTMQGRQALMYDKARSELELELRRLDNTSFKKKLVTYFQKRAALLQICSNPSAIDPTMTEHSVKLDRLDQLLEELISQGRKVILWSFYKKSLDELTRRYSRYSPVRIDGSIDINTRRAAVKSFQEDSTKMLFIGNPAAAGAGITLHAAYDAVYVSFSNQAAHYLQSLDRIHRRGQKSKEVNYYLLVCQETIEETEVLRLRNKELNQHSLLGDHIQWPSSLDEALKELSHVGI